VAHVAFDKAWEDAKKEFETITKQKKPKESKKLKNAFGSHTGLSGSLTKCEKKYVECNSIVDTDVKKGGKAAKSFAGALKDFSKAKTTYMKVLEDAIYKELVDRPEKDVKSVYERALKYLKKELAALEATISASVDANIQKFDSAAQDLSVKEKMLKNWQKNIKGALARAAAGAAKVKAKPTPETYNELFPTAARDITMQLVFARDIPDLKADPDTFKAKLDPWANQSTTGLPVKVPAEYTDKEILALLKSFTKELKNVVQLVDNRK
jgi:hypothetical protein